MKKYENPEITITMFDSESVLCDSALSKARAALEEDTTVQSVSTASWDQFTIAF